MTLDERAEGSACTHYLNADFDLSLRSSPASLGHGRNERQVRELSSLALLGASAGDCVLVRAEIPGEFLDYLESCGLGVPRVRVHPDVDPGLPLRPFGWNDDAIALNRKLTPPASHPSLTTVRRVNGPAPGLP